MTFFIDVGAGCGEIFTLDDVVPPEQRKATRLLCIEPSPRNFVHLMAAAEQHGHEWADVALFNAALTDTTGIGELHLKTDHSGDSLVREWAENEPKKFCLWVGTIHVAQLLRRLPRGFKPYNRVVLKLDCEGAESDILMSLLDDPAFMAYYPRILVEWHDADPDCRHYLERTYKQRGIELELWNH